MIDHYVGTFPHSALYCVDQKDNLTQFLNSAQHRWGHILAEQSMDKNKTWINENLFTKRVRDLVFDKCLGKHI